MVAYKREASLKVLLTRADSYKTINIVDDDEMHSYVPCHKQCDSCMNFIVSKSRFECFTTKRICKIRQSVLCVCKNVIYIAFCLSYSKQGVGSTVDWKTRLRNYKSHIKKKLRSCSLANYFLDVCSDTEDPSKIHYN